MTCANAACGHPLHEGARQCSECGADAGFPNVRKASLASEADALSRRVDAVRRDADARGCTQTLAEFETVVADSEAVAAVAPLVAYDLFRNQHKFHVSYHRRVDAGIQDPGRTRYDDLRKSVDAKLFPDYFDEISFAALTIDGRGVRHYGRVFLVLATDKIRDRSSVFERNSFHAVENLKMNEPVPEGCRATWERRASLAAAKLGGAVQAGMSQSQMSELLLSRDDSDTADFVEVHFFGRIHQGIVAKVGFQAKSGPLLDYDKHDNLIMELTSEIARARGIPRRIFL